MTCLLCTKPSKEFLFIFEERGQQLDINSIIRKHFWLQPEANDPSTNAICYPCWDSLDAFRKFYRMVEEAHAKLVDVKLSMEDDTDDTQPVFPATDVKAESGEENNYEVVEPEPIVDSESEIPLVALTKRRKSSDDLANRSPHLRKVKETTETSNLSKKSSTSCREFDNIIKQNIQLSCNICQLPLDSFFSLKNHYQSAHNEVGYVLCCGKKFDTRHALAHHIILHQNPDCFKCSTCNKVLANKKSFRNHLNTHINNERIHQCDKCGKSFAKKEKLDKHKQGHVKPERICEQCGKVTRNLKQHQFREHSKGPRQRVQCQKCGTWLADSSSLNTHMKYQHPAKEMLHVCSICGKISSTGYGLKRHIQYMHQSERRHKCPMCEKAFKLAQNLRVSRNPFKFRCIFGSNILLNKKNK